MRQKLKKLVTMLLSVCIVLSAGITAAAEPESPSALDGNSGRTASAYSEASLLHDADSMNYYSIEPIKMEVSNLMWSRDGTASWDAAEGADAYQVRLHNDWGYLSDCQVGTNSCKFSLTEWDSYQFDVLPLSDDPMYESIGFSPLSEKLHAVGFITGGGSPVEMQFVPDGETAEIPDAPDREGYTFDGWYANEVFTTEYDFNSAVTHAIFLYAKWTEAGDNNDSGSDTPPSPDNDNRPSDDDDDDITVTRRTANGTTAYTVTIPRTVVAKSAKNGTPIELPLKNLNDLSTIHIDLPRNCGPVQIQLPVKNATAGMVAILMKSNGTEVILMTDIVKNGLVVTLDKDASLKIRDNSLAFSDIPENNVFADAVDYMTARRLMNGLTDDTFSGNLPTTRAMIWTILGRGQGADLYGDGVFARAAQWAVDNSISDGTVPNGHITRQQLAVMLWRLAKLNGADVSSGEDTNILSYNDAFDIAEYAFPAMQWACAEGILQGDANGNLNPAGSATRYHIAAMYMRYMEAIG